MSRMSHFRFVPKLIAKVVLRVVCQLTPSQGEGSLCTTRRLHLSAPSCPPSSIPTAHPLYIEGERKRERARGREGERERRGRTETRNRSGREERYGQRERGKKREREGDKTTLMCVYVCACVRVRQRSGGA
jgi:hypothetical protein